MGAWQEILRPDDSQSATLYLNAKTKKRVLTPKSQVNFVAKDTGEICWRAFECRNPNCPAKAVKPDLFLFITQDPAIYIKPDGALDFYEGKANETIQQETTGGCPEYLKIRNIESEPAATRERCASYVRPHILPETAKRLKESDEEYKRRIEWENKKK